MYKIRYKDKSTNTIEEKIYNTNDEEKAINQYKMYISINPGNYEAIEIINIEEIEMQEAEEKQKTDNINNTIKDFKKILKALIKKPYNSKNQMIYKEIEIKSNIKYAVIEEIKKMLEPANWENGFLYDNKIEVYFRNNIIEIHATKEYFNNAE